MDTQAFLTLHRDLPREGPGSDACTREALYRLPTLPANPRILDLGCGPGRQTVVLAKTLQATIIAVDIHRYFLDQLHQVADESRLSHLIELRQGDMRALEIEPGTVDLLWSEGAIYILGFSDGIRRWRPLLAPGGLMAVSECSWLSEDRPTEAVNFWRESYPTMGSRAENIATAIAAGFEVLDTFILPPSAWWDEYYTPLLERAERLLPTADDDLKAVIEAAQHEVDLYRKHGQSFGYVFYLMQKAD